MDDPWRYANERIKPQRSTYHMIPLIYIVQNKQIYRDRKKIVCLGRGGRYKEWSVTASGHYFSFRDDENVLKFIVVMVAQLWKYTKTTKLYTLIWWILWYVSYTQ